MTIPSLPCMTLSLAHLAATRAACDALNDLGIALTEDDVTSIRNSLLSPVRAAMIRDKYHNARLKGIKSESLQVELAAEHNLSYGSIHLILFRK